ncbi:hypothetical protein T4B_3648, partial [Trichinella pseudospiralis]
LMLMLPLLSHSSVTSVVDNATVRCFIDGHAITAPEWRTTSRNVSTIISVIAPVGIRIHVSEDTLNGSPMCLSRIIRKTTDNLKRISG